MQLTINRFIFLLMACLTGFANAQPRESIEGVHYRTLAAPISTESDPDIIEVREFFWYGCPDCSSLAPLMTNWRDNVRGDLVLVRTPAVWNDIMALHAKIYFTAKAVDAEDQIHQAAFRAIQQQNNPLRTESQIKALFLANNVSEEKFESAWNSPEVSAAVQQSQLHSGDYEIKKLPSIVVNGHYLVTHNEKVFNHIELNIAVNMVVRNLRDERRSDF